MEQSNRYSFLEDSFIDDHEQPTQRETAKDESPTPPAFVPVERQQVRHAIHFQASPNFCPFFSPQKSLSLLPESQSQGRPRKPKMDTRPSADDLDLEELRSPGRMATSASLPWA